MNAPIANRLFVALQDLYNALDPDTVEFQNPDSEQIAREAYEKADIVMQKFEFELGPLPEWARSFNYLLELKNNVQLITRNPRRMGNAMVYGVYAGDTHTIYEVITDMGNEMKLTASEVHELFEIGDYIMASGALAARRRNQEQ